jgi:hypothetical protein
MGDEDRTQCKERDAGAGVLVNDGPSRHSLHWESTTPLDTNRGSDRFAMFNKRRETSRWAIPSDILTVSLG